VAIVPIVSKMSFRQTQWQATTLLRTAQFCSCRNEIFLAQFLGCRPTVQNRRLAKNQELQDVTPSSVRPQRNGFTNMMVDSEKSF